MDDRDAALNQAKRALLAARMPHGAWHGELSASALSTATAVAALCLLQRQPGSGATPTAHADRIAAGMEWLARHANEDGGWGDTLHSLSNLSTTTLAWAALGLVPEADGRYADCVAGAERWLARAVDTIPEALKRDPSRLARAIIRRYGRDRTFSVPILTMSALAGRLGLGRAAWRDVIPLPFELSVFPHAWFAALRLPVVSYALPALIAIGHARFHHAPPRNPLTRWMRRAAKRRAFEVLERIQPSNGGFLEATPLTSFVTMSLAGCGMADHPVARRGAAFLQASQREDGSWPIDTNLATWVTTLALNGLGPDWPEELGGMEAADAVAGWLLRQQYQTVHPYTQAAPGGWAWTDLPGGVPDADDTAGALLALRAVHDRRVEVRAAAEMGLSWLCDLQNRDGGVPTFCRGWGTLPFDRSSADITAHALRAWGAWYSVVGHALQARMRRAQVRAVRFLAGAQRPDGAWLPLWFGNQFAPDDANLTYGTARVVAGLSEVTDAVAGLAAAKQARALARSGAGWLAGQQNADGGWGGARDLTSTVEETALAVEALASLSACGEPDWEGPMASGTEWLIARVRDGSWTSPSPIGFYFAKLWYYEALYPRAMTVGALQRVARLAS